MFYVLYWNNFFLCVEKKFVINSVYDIRYEKLFVYLIVVNIIYIFIN